MADNQNSNETIPKLLNIPIRDWAYIIGGLFALGTWWVNTAGSSAKSEAQQQTLLKEMADLKTMVKELQADHRNNYKELDKRTTDNAVSIKVLEQRMNEFDKRR